MVFSTLYVVLKEQQETNKIQHRNQGKIIKGKIKTADGNLKLQEKLERKEEKRKIQALKKEAEKKEKHEVALKRRNIARLAKQTQETRTIFTKKITHDGGFYHEFDCGLVKFIINVNDLISRFELTRSKNGNFDISIDLNSIDELIEKYYEFNGSFEVVKKFGEALTEKEKKEQEDARIEAERQRQEDALRRRNEEEEAEKKRKKEYEQRVQFEWAFLKSLREDAGLSAKGNDSLKPNIPLSNKEHSQKTDSISFRRRKFERGKTVVETDKRGKKRRKKTNERKTQKKKKRKNIK